ncbi:lymphocyte antigen 75 isoform X1 [Hemibagrus wyckioides]|uniref:lymphocyte antigen 75 isoform X1 n=1 Tax=Hemibagrus wyckioides TaxID=337641 RepID=UPI00266B6F44|nr:lymphocyte antigen 75 isoform X1 [Hemibagrus wyckioides]
MDWLGHGVLCAILCLLFGESAVHFGSCAPAVSTVDDGTFSIQHEGTGKCFLVQEDSLILGNCSSATAQQWKWGSGHRLFHTGLSKCLGLDILSKTLSLTSCYNDTILRWRCYEGYIVTTFQMKLSVTANGIDVTAKRDTYDFWRRGGTSESICEQPYRTVHTSGGNSNGAPCTFPFLYNNTWHHSCLPPDASHSQAWCSTTENYDEDPKWGNCLQYEEGCGALWDGPYDGRCYQIVSTAMVTWHEARDSCRSQGGDLLSVSSPRDLQKLQTKDLPEQLWIGLNQLDWAQGWQWSDASPLVYFPWEEVQQTWMSPECGVMRPNLRFGGESCEKKLPYICEKKDNQTETTDKQVYKATECESGWFPWQGYCYNFYGSQMGERKSYAEAQQVCVENKAHLASIHSLEEMHMLTMHFAGKTLNPWIGLKAESNTEFFKWEDGTNPSFTYWARNQPAVLKPNTTNCVVLSDLINTWSVDSCTALKSFLCKKTGKVNETENSCPHEGDWRRYKNSCYKLDTRKVSYKNSCKIIVNDKFEQAFINSLLKEHVSSEHQHFWTGLQDTKGTGEYQWFSQDGKASQVTYTNWKWGEPVKVGGCAVMSTSPMGQWSVENCTEFKAGSICKNPIASEPPTPTSPADPNSNATCPSGWVSRTGLKYCYKVFNEERVSRKRSWEEAEQFCEALGAHLPSFTEHEEMTFLHEIMRDSVSDDRYFWVGLNRRNPNSDNRWEWSDGQPVSMKIFPEEFHEDDEYNRDCTAFKSLRKRYILLFIFLTAEGPNQFYPRAFHCDAKLEWVCQIPRGQTPKTPEWYNPDGHHNTSVFMDGQEFWFVSQPKLSFEEASMYCSSNKSKLATPLSFNTARHLHEHLYKHAGMENWWVDLREPGPLVPLRLARLHVYHSMFLGRCTSLSPGSFTPDFQVRCDTKLNFVCETLNVTSSETETQEPHPPGKPCETGTFAFRDKCYTVTKPQFMSFKAADEVCQTLRGSLPSIRDQAEQDFITTLLPGKPKKVWIGFRSNQWVDKTPMKYHNFNPLIHGQLRLMYTNFLEQESMELCAYMFNDPHSDMLGTWDYTSCSDEQSVAICQHYADKQEDPVVEEGEFQANSYTFKVVLKENVTWFEAEELCKKNKMDLASVADAYQQALLSVRVSKAQHPLWIGLFSENDELYHWTDHSHTMFSRWGPEETVGGCVYLDTDGFWKATECGEKLNGAICGMPQVKIIPSEDTKKCPHESNGPNWIPFRNNCYTFLLRAVRWQEHDNHNEQQTCQRLVGKGDILTIRHEEENEFIKTQLQPFKDLASFVWLGMYRDKKDGKLKWYDDTYIQYSNWRKGRPTATEPFMAGLSLTGEWYLFEQGMLFKHFKQRAIVVCKIENDPRDEYRKDPTDVKTPTGYSFSLVAKKLNWYQALKECSSDGGHLVSIHNETTNSDMALISKRDGFPLWIGLSRLDLNWPYEWSDGTALQFHPEGFLSTDTVSEEKCIYIDSTGSWTAVNCLAEMEGAICYNSNQKSQVAAQSSINCPGSNGEVSWIQYKDSCYAIVMTMSNYTVFSIEHAQNICMDLGPTSQLLTIKSMDENDFVTRHVAENPLATSRVWLGLQTIDKDKAAVWMDGSTVDFSNWGHIQPHPGCAVLVSMNGTWSTVSCTGSHSRVVCKAPAKSHSSPVALVFFLIVLLCVVALVIFVVYKRTRHRYFSTVRYRRNYDEADSASMIAETD